MRCSGLLVPFTFWPPFRLPRVASGMLDGVFSYPEGGELSSRTGVYGEYLTPSEAREVLFAYIQQEGLEHPTASVSPPAGVLFLWVPCTLRAGRGRRRKSLRVLGVVILPLALSC